MFCISESQKSEADISQAIKVPPMPGQSRSLLQFAPSIKEEFNVASENTVEAKNVINKIKVEAGDPASPFHDHDYFVVNTQPAAQNKKKIVSYIEADVPPQGYGFVETPTGSVPGSLGGYVMKEEKNSIFGQDDVYVVVEDDDESQLNVNVTGSGSGTRTVVLHVPKDIK